MSSMWLNILIVIVAWYGKSADAVLCEVGEALKDANNPDVDRVCGTGCPNNYYCVQAPSVQAGGICCRTRASACLQQVSYGASCGTASLASQRYYFDPTRSMCCPFTYNGCLGNLNNFATSQECVTKCTGVLTPDNNQLCPAGSSAQPGTTSATPCNMTPFVQCQTGFACTFSNALQRSYCCGSNTISTQFCPAGFTAAPGTLATSTCSSLTGCTPGYLCMQSPGNGQFYCCGQQTNNQNLCPVGSSAAPGITVNTPCQPGFACATAGYTCQRSPFNGFNYCCSNQGTTTNVLCPLGGTAVMFAGTNQVVTCGAGVGCTSPYVCQNTVIAGVNTGVCCTSNSNPAINSDCPTGYTPYRNPNNRMIICNVNGIIQPQMCPVGTTCVWSPSQRTNVCCGAARRGRKLERPSNSTIELAGTTELSQVAEAQTTLKP